MKRILILVGALTLGWTAPAAADKAKDETPTTSAKLSLKGINAVGAGYHLEMNEEESLPFITFRRWFSDRIGVALKFGATSRRGLTEVSTSPTGDPGTTTMVAEGQRYLWSAMLGVFYGVAHSQNAGLFVFGAGGPTFRKEMRRDAAKGVRLGFGLGIEYTPSSIPSVGVTLEGGYWYTSYASDELGTTFAPTLTIGFHYYLNR